MVFLRAYAINYDALCPSNEEVGDPFMDVFVDAIQSELPKESLVWNRIEGLGEIQYCDIDLVALVSLLHEVVCG